MPTVWTIGYEAAGFAAFVDTLKAAGIATVADLRDLPLSRRAGFSKNVLAASLAEAGIGYAHFRQLGTPKEGRLAARRGDYGTFWRIFEQRLTTPESVFELQRLAELAGGQPTALMCFEADPAKCHRRRVGELLAERFGFTVKNLKVPGPGTG